MIELVKEIPVRFGPHWADERMLWITGAGVVVTAGVALLTLWANYKSGEAQKTATAAMTEAVAASKAAAERQASALSRLVEGLNTKTREGNGARVQWELKQGEGRSRWALKNVGEGTALEALVLPVTAEDLVDFSSLVSSPLDVGPGAEIPFRVDRSLASPPTTLVSAVWKDEDGDQLTATFVVS